MPAEIRSRLFSNSRPAGASDAEYPPAISLQLDVDLVLAALDRVDQSRFVRSVEFLGDREPSRDGRSRRWLWFCRAISLDRNEVRAFGVDAAHSNLGLAYGQAAHGVAAITGNIAVAETPVLSLERDRPPHQRLALVADLAGHVPFPLATGGG